MAGGNFDESDTAQPSCKNNRSSAKSAFPLFFNLPFRGIKKFLYRCTRHSQIDSQLKTAARTKNHSAIKLILHMKFYTTPTLREIKLNAEPVMNTLSMEKLDITKKTQVLTQEDYVNPIWGEAESTDDATSAFGDFTDF